MAQGIVRFDGEHSYTFQLVEDVEGTELEIGGRAVAEFIAAEAGLSFLDALANIEVPDDASEGRLVFESSRYPSGFETSGAFSTDQSPAEFAAEAGITGNITRVIYGRS
jgi:hypothetical protein